MDFLNRRRVGTAADVRGGRPAYQLAEDVALTAAGVYHQAPDPLSYDGALGECRLAPMRSTQAVLRYRLGVVKVRSHPAPTSIGKVFDRSNVYRCRYSDDYSRRSAIRSLFNRCVYVGGSLTHTPN